MSHVMIDLETMGVGPRPAILSIGAVMFDPTSRSLGPDRFYVCVDLTSCLLNGLEVEPDTVKWWREQSDEAKAALTSDRRQPLGEALWMLDGWLRLTEAEYIWTNGPMSDHLWLESAYRAVGMKPLMERKNGYRAPRDYRTIVEAAELVADFDRTTIPRPTVAHDALADACAQAIGVQMAFAALRDRGRETELGQDDIDSLIRDRAHRTLDPRTATAYEVDDFLGLAPEATSLEDEIMNGHGGGLIFHSTEKSGRSAGLPVYGTQDQGMTEMPEVQKAEDSLA